MTPAIKSSSARISQKKRSIGIYRRVYPLASETFISEQMRYLSHYDPLLITNQLTQHNLSTPTLNVGDGDTFSLRQIAFLLTRSPLFLRQLQSAQHLSLLHAHFGTDGVYAMQIAKKLQIPLVVTFHGYDVTLKLSKFGLSSRPLHNQLIWNRKSLQNYGAGFIAVSNFVKDKLLEQNYPEHKIHQHYIGIDTEKFCPIQRQGSRRYIFSVGRHTEKKGLVTLLKAFARICNQHPDVSLIQVGTGKLSQQLQALTQSLGIAHRVEFLGAQPHDVVLKLMQEAEIFSLPSQTAQDGDSEALGIVFNEASACGIPIVSTWHGGIPEAVKDGETGFLVPEQDDESLAQKLHELLSNANLRARFGEAGRAYVCEKFDLQKQTQRLEAIYDSCLS